MKNLKVGLVLSLLVVSQGLVAGDEQSSKVWDSLDQASKAMLYAETLAATSLATGAVLHKLDDTITIPVDGKDPIKFETTAWRTVGRISGAKTGFDIVMEKYGFGLTMSENKSTILTNSALAFGGCTAIGSLGLGLPASQAALGCAALEASLTAAIYALNNK